MCIKPRTQSGFTLIELIISIVILSIALVSIMAVYTRAVLNSVDPMLQQQAVAIAEAYMEEISGMRTGSACTETSSSTNRGSWRYIGDYQQLAENHSPTNIHGETIPALADYRVNVTIRASDLNSVSGCLIEVTVSHDRFSTIRVDLQGFRALDEVVNAFPPIPN